MKTYLSYFIDAKGKRRLEQLKAQNRVQCFDSTGYCADWCVVVALLTDKCWWKAAIAWFGTLFWTIGHGA